MKKITLAYTKPVYTFTFLSGFLVCLGIAGYCLADYPLEIANVIQADLPSRDSFLQWIATF